MFLKAFIQANDMIDEALATGSGETYDRIITLATEFSGTNETVVLSSTEHMDLDYHMGDNFETYLIDYTQSYIDLGLIPESKLADRGYANVTEYVKDLVQKQYLEAVE